MCVQGYGELYINPFTEPPPLFLSLLDNFTKYYAPHLEICITLYSKEVFNVVSQLF